MSARGATNPDPADDIAFNLNRQATAQDEDSVVHLPQRLERRHLIDQLSQLTGWPSQTGRGIGLLAAAVCRVWSGPVATHEYSEHPGTVDDRCADAKAILLTLLDRSCCSLTRQRQR